MAAKQRSGGGAATAVKVSFIVHAGAALALGAFCEVAGLLTFLPGPSWPGDGGPVLGGVLALLLPLLLGAAVRALALTARGVDARGNRALQWLALRCLPGIVQVALAGVFAAGVALIVATVVVQGSLRAGEAVDGRYHAVRTDRPGHEVVEVSRAEYEDLLEQDHRFLVAALGMPAGAAAAVTLVTGQLHPGTPLQGTPEPGRIPV
ncbi:hypothetical protein PV350_35515 [Streptomyces sp. PA03-6a]|nr:hypothetical protein [Streptomyces sp. PA03-6a]